MDFDRRESRFSAESGPDMITLIVSHLPVDQRVRTNYHRGEIVAELCLPKSDRCGMRAFRTLAVLIGFLALSACVSATSEPSFDQKEDDYIPFAAAILTIAEGQGPTLAENIGNAGPIYTGIVHASTAYVENPACNTCKFSGDGPLTQYLADLYLVADFGGQTLSGNLSKFFTPIAGFKNPNGTITLVGNFSKSEPKSTSADITFSGLGTLTGSGMSANYEIFDVYGGFGGVNGQIMVGGFSSDFDWISGAYAGTTSESDGLWVTQEQ